MVVNHHGKKGMMAAFSLKQRVVLITGGAGLLGPKHAEAVAEAGGTAVILDINKRAIERVLKELKTKFPNSIGGICCDITKQNSIRRALGESLKRFGRVDALINNAANDPKVVSGASAKALMRFENIPLQVWEADLAVGLTGAFLCSQIVGCHLAGHGGGVILNIASDLALIAPDQRIYRQDGLPDDKQPVKPVTYSVVKAGLLGLTRYLATYWAAEGVRANALCPGGIFNNQDAEFVKRLTNLIPMNRMANIDEYKAAVVFLLSDASQYMTGATVVMDGGRTVW